MQYGHGAWTCSVDMQRGHASCSMDMRQGLKAWTSMTDTGGTGSKNIQVFISKICSMDIKQGHGMQHGHGHATHTEKQHGHAARTCSMDISMDI
jgi:hypothetical protein